MKISLFAIILIIVCSCSKSTETKFISVENSNLRGSAKFYKPQLSNIQPKGWIKTYLDTQAGGITGNLDQIGGYPFDLPTWDGTEKIEDKRAQSSWWPFEQTGYWIEGMIRTGRLLDNQQLIDKAKKYIDTSISHAAKDGFIGPEFLKKTGETNRWVHVVYFRALMTEYEATKDQRIVDAIHKHLLYDLDFYPYKQVREMGIIESMLWTYQHTNDIRLLEAAKRIFIDGCKANSSRSSSPYQINNASRPINEHGVTYNEFARLGAILYSYTGEEKFLKISLNAFNKLENQAMLVDGVNSSTELLKGKDPLASHETCDVVELIYGWSVLFQATGNPKYADKMERIAFNAAPGGVTEDFKAMQYFSSPNQAIVCNNSNHNHYMQGNNSMQFAPNAWIKCCPGQVSRTMPIFSSQFWYINENKLFAGTYGANYFSAETTDGEKITIEEITSYPFDEKIDFKITTEKDIKFSLNLRVPSWCFNGSLQLNGEKLDKELIAGSYIEIDRVFKSGDTVTLTTPMEVNMINTQQHSAAFEYGPLLFTLPIDEIRTVDRESELSKSEDAPALSLTPNSSWNYAFAVRQDNYKELIKVSRTDIEVKQWAKDRAPIKLTVPARVINNWKLEELDEVLQEDYWPTHKADTVSGWNMRHYTIKGDFRFTPELPTHQFIVENISKKLETIELIPYGFSNLRMTILPISPID